MIRKHALAALAVLAMGLVVSTPAQAGGTSGAVGVKKNANVIVKNATASEYYVLVVPDSLVSGSTSKFGTPGTVGWAKKLGAAKVKGGGGTLTYPVPAGPGFVSIYATGTSLNLSDPNAELPFPAAEDDYNVKRGRNVTETIKSDSFGPYIE